METPKKTKRSFAKKAFYFLLLIIMGFWLFNKCTGKKIMWSGVYELARAPNWTPIVDLSRQKNLQAFMEDLMQAVIQSESLKLNISIINEASLLPDLDAGIYDGVFSSVQPNRYNQSLYAFSDPIIVVGPVLIVSEESKINSLDEMSGKIVGIESANSSLAENLASHPDIIVRTYDSVSLLVDDITSGRIDGAFVPIQMAWSYTRGMYRGKLKIVTIPLTDSALRLVAKNSQDGKELIEKFNSSLKKIREENVFESLLRKWDLL